MTVESKLRRAVQWSGLFVVESLRFWIGMFFCGVGIALVTRCCNG